MDFYGDDSRLDNPENLYTLEDTPFVGLTGSVTADVLDSNIQGLLGSSEATIVYDLDAWVVPHHAGTGTSVLVEGDVFIYHMASMTTELLENVPLALRFENGGSVIYTSFHNEQQLTADMEIALKEIILSL